MLSYCADERGVITGLCPDDLTGNTGWNLAAEGFGIGLDDEIYDSKGAGLYKVVKGKAVLRTEAERREDWIPEQAEDVEFTTDDIVETLADHEFRVCLLELGIMEEDLL